MRVRIELIDDRGRTYIGEADLAEAQSRRKSRTVPPLKEKRALTLPGRILSLREKGFFSSAKASPEVFEEITKTYDCQPDRVTMALIRLQKGKQLRKAVKMYKGKRLNAYAW